MTSIIRRLKGKMKKEPRQCSFCNRRPVREGWTVFGRQKMCQECFQIFGRD